MERLDGGVFGTAGQDARPWGGREARRMGEGLEPAPSSEPKLLDHDPRPAPLSLKDRGSGCARPAWGGGRKGVVMSCGPRRGAGGTRGAG